MAKSLVIRKHKLPGRFTGKEEGGFWPFSGLDRLFGGNQKPVMVKKKPDIKPDYETPITPELMRANRVIQDERVIRRHALASCSAAIAAKLATIDSEEVNVAEKHAFRDYFLYIDGSPNVSIITLFKEAFADKVSFEHYARRMLTFFAEDRAVLKRVLESLFAFAEADGPLNIEEIVFLKKVSGIFKFSDSYFHQLLRYYLIPESKNPFKILGVSRKVGLSELKTAYRKSVSAYHPDKLHMLMNDKALLEISKNRVQIISDAYDSVRRKRKFV